MSKAPFRDRGKGPAALRAQVDKIVVAATGERSFALAGLLAHWKDIVGPEDAGQIMPLSLRFPTGKQADGTLSVRCTSALAVELQHRTGQLIERVNGYFGYRAVTRLRIEHGRVSSRRPLRLSPLTPAEERTALAGFDGLSPNSLVESLKRFALARAQREKTRR
ncbi:MAG TPA: DciA family protein [Dongiaceae bacterium]|jgi:hypothetical protein|nr:DciA family protein [Dongiaceae bacterium]